MINKSVEPKDFAAQMDRAFWQRCNVLHCCPSYAQKRPSMKQ